MAYSLILWWPFAVLPDEVGAVVQLVMWGAIDVLLLLVIRWRSRVLRAAAGVMFAIQILVMVEDLLDELDIWEFDWNDVAWWIYIAVCVAATVLTVAGQWRDGRWSRGTLIAGWLSLTSFAFNFPIGTFFEPLTSAWPTSMVVSHVLGLLGVVWNAATAREMPVADGHPVAASSRRRGWGHRVALAAMLVVPMVVMIQPEQNARHTFDGGSPDCYGRPSFATSNPRNASPRSCAWRAARITGSHPCSLTACRTRPSSRTGGSCAGRRTVPSRRRSCGRPGARGPPGASTAGTSSTSAPRSSRKPSLTCCAPPSS
ncbi:hypothetical protein ABZW11_31340 [Nonomuraea sp. NPDC004580]|uniref:hypothetical protein n=1 Tax=Nonomuraea sp. NPDC004580 TaxID=3154552 RepID=UPI0033A95FE7